MYPILITHFALVAIRANKFYNADNYTIIFHVLMNRYDIELSTMIYSSFLHPIHEGIPNCPRADIPST